MKEIIKILRRAEVALGLKAPTPVVFSLEIKIISEELTRLLNYLSTKFPAEKFIKLAHINSQWANTGNNPLGGLAEMGNQGADKIINPKSHIFREIKRLKDKIEELRKKMDQDPNAKKIVGMWDYFEINEDLANVELDSLPRILKNFSDKLAQVQ